MNVSIVLVLVFLFLVVLLVARTAVIVPQQRVYVVERIGKYNRTLGAGFHVLAPFVDQIRVELDLKETTLDTPKQECITKDNVTIGVDAILYYRIMDPEKAIYGVEDYLLSLGQLSQTTLRSEIGCMTLDEVLSGRIALNQRIVGELDNACQNWGIKIFRFEIQAIDTPKDVMETMERQMRAERNKRATILESEGNRDAAINNSEAEKAQVVKVSEATQLRYINEARGQAEAILAIAEATAKGIEIIAQAITKPGGEEASRLKLASQYIEQFGKIAQGSSTVVLPANIADVGSMLTMANELWSKTKPNTCPPLTEREKMEESIVSPLLISSEEDDK